MGRADSPGCKSHFPICWGAGVVIGHLITLASIVAQRGSSQLQAYQRNIVLSQETYAKSYLDLITNYIKFLVWVRVRARGRSDDGQMMVRYTPG